MRSHLIRCAGILAAIHGVATSSIIQKRRASKIDEFNGTDCLTTYPDGSTNDPPVWHHQPPIDECIGIDASTLSVRIITGTGDAPAWGFYKPGLCDNNCQRDIVFDQSIDDGSSCHSVKRTVGDDTYRVHDIEFQAYGAVSGVC